MCVRAKVCWFPISHFSLLPLGLSSLLLYHLSPPPHSNTHAFLPPTLPPRALTKSQRSSHWYPRRTCPNDRNPVARTRAIRNPILRARELYKAVSPAMRHRGRGHIVCVELCLYGLFFLSSSLSPPLCPLSLHTLSPIPCFRTTAIASILPSQSLRHALPFHNQPLRLGP